MNFVPDSGLHWLVEIAADPNPCRRFGILNRDSVISRIWGWFMVPVGISTCQDLRSVVFDWTGFQWVPILWRGVWKDGENSEQSFEARCLNRFGAWAVTRGHWDSATARIRKPTWGFVVPPGGRVQEGVTITTENNGFSFFPKPHHLIHKKATLKAPSQWTWGAAHGPPIRDRASNFELVIFQIVSLVPRHRAPFINWMRGLHQAQLIRTKRIGLVYRSGMVSSS